MPRTTYPEKLLTMDNNIVSIFLMSRLYLTGVTRIFKRRDGIRPASPGREISAGRDRTIVEDVRSTEPFHVRESLPFDDPQISSAVVEREDNVIYSDDPAQFTCPRAKPEPGGNEPRGLCRGERVALPSTIVQTTNSTLND